MKEMKIAISAFVFAVASTVLMHADTTQKPVDVENPHAIYVGPDLFYGYQHSSDKWVKEKSHGLFEGIRAQYDFLLPSAWYVGFDALYSWGKSHSKAESKVQASDLQEKIWTAKTSDRSNLAQLEGRIGYNFLPWTKFMFTPFVGVGGYRIDSNTSVFFDEDLLITDLQIRTQWAYYALGARTQFIVSPTFDFGLNATAMRAFKESIKVVHPESRFKIHSNGKQWGYEIAMPLTWHIGKTQKWDVQAEPYFLMLKAKDDFKIFGGRFLIGYRF